jgi:multidrug efflux system membrane fusion protein
MKRYVLSLVLLGGIAQVFASELETTVDWNRRVTLSVPVTGVIEAVDVKMGDRVGQGQVLLRLDSRGFRAAVDGGEARLDRAKPALEEAGREVERAQELYDLGALSDHELQLTRIALSQARAEYRLAEAGLTQARLDLEYSTLRAPFDGLVLETHVAAGETVVTRTQSVPLVTLVRADRRRADVLVSEEQAARLMPGAEVSVRVGGQRYPAVIEALRPEASPAGALHYRAVAVFAVIGIGAVWPGQRAVLELP